MIVSIIVINPRNATISSSDRNQESPTCQTSTHREIKENLSVIMKAVEILLVREGEANSINWNISFFFLSGDILYLYLE